MDTQTKATRQITLNIGGMACGGCASTVQGALNDIKGVIEAKVDLENASAFVTFEASAVSMDDFEQAIKDAGYDLKGISD